MLKAADAGTRQLPEPAPPTLSIYGYQIGAEADPLLSGHPDLAY